MRKLKAYTIMEMTVVMFISAIVMSIAFKSYYLLSSSFVDFKRRYQRVGEVAMLDRLITLDFVRSREVVKTDEGFDCVFEENKINYVLFPEFILRNQMGVEDTFFVNPESIQYKFLDEVVEEEGKIMNELIFENMVEGETQYFQYKKEYGSDKLMEQNKIKTE